MKVHILFESSDHTNGRVVGVWTDRRKANKAFVDRVREVASPDAGDVTPSDNITRNEDGWTYIAEDFPVSVMLFLDVEVTA